MDKMAENGICGIMDPIKPGIRPGSDTSHIIYTLDITLMKFIQVEAF